MLEHKKPFLIYQIPTLFRIFWSVNYNEFASKGKLSKKKSEEWKKFALPWKSNRQFSFEAYAQKYTIE